MQNHTQSIMFLGISKGEKTNDVLVTLGKMKPNMFEYACKVILHVNKDGSCQLCGDYRLFNLQTY
jgi:hypothetical protein